MLQLVSPPPVHELHVFTPSMAAESQVPAIPPKTIFSVTFEPDAPETAVNVNAASLRIDAIEAKTKNIKRKPRQLT